jgi:hypothetical protein
LPDGQAAIFPVFEAGLHVAFFLLQVVPPLQRSKPSCSLSYLMPSTCSILCLNRELLLPSSPSLVSCSTECPPGDNKLLGEPANQARSNARS